MIAESAGRDRDAAAGAGPATPSDGSQSAGPSGTVRAEKVDGDDRGGRRRGPAGPAGPAPRIAVVIPALHEAARIHATVSSARAQFPGGTVFVVDGGSRDDTVGRARAAGATVIAAARGRGGQCRTGSDAAAQAGADWLLFLHADTRLPENAGDIVARYIARPEAKAATFRLRFEAGGWFLRACAWFTRFDSVFTRFGDQGILIRRSFYDDLGGFPAWPLFEDVELLQRVRKKARLHSLPAAVTTSTRRFERRGPLRQQWLNGRLLLRYLAGASPEKLAAIYRPDPASPLPAAGLSRPVSGQSREPLASQET